MVNSKKLLLKLFLLKIKIGLSLYWSYCRPFMVWTFWFKLLSILKLFLILTLSFLLLLVVVVIFAKLNLIQSDIQMQIFFGKNFNNRSLAGVDMNCLDFLSFGFC